MLTETEQASINANNQEVLRARYGNIMLAKYFLHFFFGVFFIVTGILLGATTVSYYASLSLWDWQSIAFLSIAFLLAFSAIYLVHRIHRNLSSKSHQNSRRLTWIDWCFSTLNFLGFCYGFIFGCACAALPSSLVP